MMYVGEILSFIAFFFNSYVFAKCYSKLSDVKLELNFLNIIALLITTIINLHLKY